MISPDMGVWVAVISTRRPENVAGMHMRWLGRQATWYVQDELDAQNYKMAGATSVKVTGPLCSSRNAALDDAFAANMRDCLQLSDDLRNLSLATSKQHSSLRAITLPRAVDYMTHVLAQYPDYRMAGCAPTANPFYSSQQIKTKHFIVGDCILVRPTPLRFNTALKIKEDYDYTCQHIKTYGGVCRLDFIMADFAHHDRGGASVWRGANPLEAENEAVATLTAAWPLAIHPNPRRPGEVLLKWPN